MNNGCRACIAQMAAEQVSGPPDQLYAAAWLTGAAIAVHSVLSKEGLDLCPEHAEAYNQIRATMGMAPSLIENLPGDGEIPPPVTLECFVTRTEFDQIKAKAMEAGSFDGIERAVRAVLGDAVWARFEGHVVGFTPCPVAPAERFRETRS